MAELIYLIAFFGLFAFACAVGAGLFVALYRQWRDLKRRELAHKRKKAS